LQSPVASGGGEPVAAVAVEDVAVAAAVFLPEEAGVALDDVLIDDDLLEVVEALESSAPYHSLTPWWP
jgi:hypothetical protein